jgi:hypothetical protein
VSIEEGREFAQANSLFFIETSALNTENVLEAFNTIMEGFYVVYFFYNFIIEIYHTVTGISKDYSANLDSKPCESMYIYFLNTSCFCSY